ncbi:MAG: MBL fold metallo-hydrolase [Nannocystaceae bacterium]
MSEDLYFRQLAVGPMQNFIYLIGSRRTQTCMVVDPAWDTDALIESAAADGMRITGMLVTHYHPDHVGGSMMGFTVPGGIADLLGKVDAKVHVNKHEADGLIKITGVSRSDLVTHDSSDHVQIGDVNIELVHTPGHTPGSQCFLVRDRLVSGDTLFVDGCGRVDLPGGDAQTMYRTLTETLGKLSDDVVLCPGHDYGPTRTSRMGDQRKTNQNLLVKSLDQWMARHR